MTQTKYNLSEFTSIKDAYPIDNAHVIIRTTAGHYKKGMFFFNGNKPSFASFGSDVPLETVEAWAYETTAE